MEDDVSERRGPPRLMAWFLGRLLPEAERDYALGDLEEGWAAITARRGRRAADRWYRGQVMVSVVPLLTIDGWKPEGRMLGGIGRDLRSAVRQFGRAPGFTAVVVGTVGLGVGGATAVWSVVHGVVRKPLALPDSEHIVTLWGQSSEYPRTPLTVGDHNVLANDVRGFESMAAEWGNTALLLGEGNAEQVTVGWVTPDYFEMLRMKPYLGRTLGPEDVNGVVIGHELWARRYGSDAGIVGRTIDLAGAPMEVVGVLRAGDNPNLTTFAGGRAANEVWRLQPADWTRGDDRSVGWLRSSARLRAGVSVEQAQAEVDALMERINLTVTNRDGGNDMRVLVKPVREDLTAGVSRTLWVLLWAVCGVLLIASTNVANLMLSRGQGRTGEVAVRSALGGSRWRIFRQLLVETAVLAIAGGVVGMAVAWAGTRALVAVAPDDLPRLAEAGLDASVLLFALAATAIAALLFGVVPALRASRTDLACAMTRRTSTGTRGEQRLGRGLVIVEVALSLCLLVGTGLLIRSLQNLAATDLGFDRDGVLTFALQTSDPVQTAEEARARLQAYIGRIEDEPGVVAVGVTNRVPLAGGIFTGNYRSESMIAENSEQGTASFRFVTPGFFEAMGARLTAGRTLSEADGLESVLVDEQLAERLWPGEDAVGKRIEHTTIGGEPVLATVAGVVSPMKHESVAESASPTLFLPMLAMAHQQNFRYMVVRLPGDPLAAVDRIADALRSVEPNTVMARIRPMNVLYDEAVSATRFASQLLAVFGAMAILLAAVGLHGVMSLAVRRRTREFGIRVALGADHRTILGGIFGSGMQVVGAGAAIGVVLALWLGRFLGSLLHGITPTDVTTLIAATLVIVGAGLVSAWLPARRIHRIDPVRALRIE